MTPETKVILGVTCTVVHDVVSQDGNLVEDGLWKYSWDSHGRLTGVESVEAVPEAARLRLAFSYDTRGRRLAKRVRRWNSSLHAYGAEEVRRYVYDDWRLVAELDRTNRLVRAYLWGPDASPTREALAGTGALLAILEAATGKVYLVVPDGAGQVRALVDAEDGTVAARYDYAPFGELLRATGPMAGKNPFRFSTKYQDDETGLVYFGRRYYSPDTGRWISRDPKEEGGGLNLYGYAHNDPLDRLDPIGEDVVYLLDPTAVRVAGHAAGHAGILIGSDATGWHYFSFSAGACRLNPFGSNMDDNLDYVGFRTFAEAAKDARLRRYKKFARWGTDHPADLKALEAMRLFFKRRYNMCTRNCDDAVAAGIRAAGVSFEDRFFPVDAFELNQGSADESGTFAH